MGYIRANHVLPEPLLAAIQDYVDGEMIYIPRKACNRRAWGEEKTTRQQLDFRNQEIYQKYLDGISVRRLSADYYLSDKTIYKIIAAARENVDQTALIQGLGDAVPR